MATGDVAARVVPGATTTSPRGTVIQIVEWSAERLAVRRTMPPGTGKGAAHFHQNGLERFTVVEGRATGAVDGAERLLGPGDVLEVPAGTSHVHPHADAGARAVIDHIIEPLAGEELPRFPQIYFASWLGWLAAGEVDAQDEPSFLQIMAVIKDGGGGTWVSGPPVAAQRVLAQLVGRAANLAGIRPASL